MIINKLLLVAGIEAVNTLARDTTNADLEMFKLAYDKSIVYGVKFADDDINFNSLHSLSIEDKQLLKRLADRSLVGAAAKQAITEHCEEHGDLVKLICNKHLRCGVSATTINRVFPGTIPVFKVQLAKEVQLNKLDFPLYAQLKCDGVRVVVTIDNNTVLFRTRNGKELYLPRTASYLLNVLGKAMYIMLDTEVTIKGGLSVDRTKVSGLLSTAQSSRRTGNYIDESLLTFNVFDCLKLEEFNACECYTPYSTRVDNTINICATIGSPFKSLPVHLVSSCEEADKLFQDVLAAGEEGLILKPINHRYTFKRSKDWVKVKAVKDCDLVCTEVISGKGKYQGMIGKLVCTGTVEGRTIKVGVGTGLSDQHRASHPSKFLRKTIEVKYNALIQDSVTRQWSLFLPRFVAVRFDK